MKLDKPNVVSLFHDPSFVKWIQYADDLSAKSSFKEPSVISTLTSLYGDKAVYEVIHAATRDTNLRKLALRLQEDQMQYWIAIRKDLSVFFDLLNLHPNWKPILTRPEFSVWLKYVDDVNAKHPETAPLSIIPTLTQSRGRTGRDGRVELVKIIKAGKESVKAETVAKRVEKELFDFWLRRRETPDKIMNVLKHDTTASTFLGSPRWKDWEKYLDMYNDRFPEKKTTAIETLAGEYGGVGLVALLTKAQLSSATKNLVAKLQAAQFEMWVSRGKSPIGVYNDLQPYYRSGDFFPGPLFKMWVSYMNAYVSKNSGKSDELFSELNSAFDGAKFFRILAEATKFPNLESAATKLRNEKASTIFASKESPKKIFKLLALDNVGKRLLSDTLFLKWMRYLESFNKANPRNQELWFDTLHINYRWSWVEIIIETGKQNPSTREMAEKVEDAFHNYWLIRKETPKETFSFLNLHNIDEKTLVDPKFSTWVKYLNTFNDRYPGEKTTVIDGIMAYYTDRALLRMFEAAKEDPSTKKLVTDLQSALIHKWQDAKDTPGKLTRILDDVPSSREMIDRYTTLISGTRTTS